MEVTELPRLDQPQYVTARSVLGLAEGIGWTLVAFGLLTALIGFATGGIWGAMSGHAPFFARVLSATPGLGVSIAGLFMVVNAQVGRAQLHAAEYARESLLLMRGGIQQDSPIGQPALSAGQSVGPSGVADSTESMDSEIQEEADGTFTVEGRNFKTRTSARDYIEFVARQRGNS